MSTENQVRYAELSTNEEIGDMYSNYTEDEIEAMEFESFLNGDY